MKTCLGNLILVFGICAAFIAIACMMLDRQIAIAIGIPCIAIAGLLIYFGARLSHREPPPPPTEEQIKQRRDAEKRKLEERIISGELTPVTFTILRAVAIEDYEDEGLHLILDIGGNGALQFCSQDLYDFACGPEYRGPDESEAEYTRSQLTLYRNRSDAYEYDMNWSGHIVPCKLASNNVWEIWPGGPIENPQGWGEIIDLSFTDVLALTDRAGYSNSED